MTRTEAPYRLGLATVPTRKQVAQVNAASRAYTVVLIPNELGGYSVEVPALPGCFTHGASVEQALDVRNLTEVARLIARTALLRDESRGSHYRADFPQTDNDRWLQNICLQRSERAEPNGRRDGLGGEHVQIEVTPVELKRLHPDQLQAVASAAALALYERAY